MRFIDAYVDYYISLHVLRLFCNLTWQMEVCQGRKISEDDEQQIALMWRISYAVLIMIQPCVAQNA